MSTINNKEGGSIESVEERLVIPSTVRVINTSGFAIPVSTLNKIWTALSQQIEKRSEVVTKSVDNNFWAYYTKHIQRNPLLSPIAVDAMGSFTDAVYGANIGQAFTLGIIPEVVWQKCGYEETRIDRALDDGGTFLDVRIWAEGFDNGMLSATHRLGSSNLSTTPYINIGTTMGQTLWSTDFLYQRMKTHNETITRLFPEELDIETVRVWEDSLNLLCSHVDSVEEAPLTPSIRDDIHQFVKDNHQFLIQTCLNNDIKECITAMQVPNGDGSIPEFPSFDRVSRIYQGLEVIPISSVGLSRLDHPLGSLAGELCNTSTKRATKAKADKKRRRKAKRKIDELGGTGEVDTPQSEIKDNHKTSKVADIVEVFTTKEKYETTKVPNDMEVATTEKNYETLKSAHILDTVTAEGTKIKTAEFINGFESIVTSQNQIRCQVATINHGREVSQTTTPFVELPASEAYPTRNETISQATSTNQPKHTTISVTSFTEAPGISLVTTTTEDEIFHPIATQAGDAEFMQIATPLENQDVSHITSAESNLNGTEDKVALTQSLSSASEDRARIIAQLRAQSPPPSIDEVKARRASIKQERRQSVEFIRARTTSRASASGRPSAHLSLAVPAEPPRLPHSLKQTPQSFSDDSANSKPTADISPSISRSLEKTSEPLNGETANFGDTVDLASTPPRFLEQTYERHSEDNPKDKFTVVPSSRMSRLSKQIPEPLPDDTTNGELAADSPPDLPCLLSQSPDKLPRYATKEKFNNDLPHSTQLSLATIQKASKRSKWIAPLPEDQDWKNVPHTSRPTVAPAAPSVPKKKNKKHRTKKCSIQSHVLPALLTDTEIASSFVAVVSTNTGITSCSVGTQTDFVSASLSVTTQAEPVFRSSSAGTQTDTSIAPFSGVQAPIVEDLILGPGPVPSREDESTGHGNTKPPPSITSCTSLQSCGELELTSNSIVEDSACEQDRGVVEHARGRLTMAAPSTSHSSLVAELTQAGVPSSALTSFADIGSGLEALEATGRPSPVGIPTLEAETVTIGGVIFETPRRRGSQHQRAVSMPEIIDSDARSEVSESVGISGTEVLAGSSNPALDVGNLGPVMTNTIATDPAHVDSVVSPVASSPETLPRHSTDVSPLALGSPLVVAPIAPVPMATPPFAVHSPVVSSVAANEPELEEMVGSRLFKEPAQAFTTSLPGTLFWNGNNMTSGEVVTFLGGSLPRPLTLEDHPRVNIFLRASHIINCAFCGLATTESFEEGPEWKQSQACPGCGPASEVRYCDEGCLLADVLEHAKGCGSQSPSCPIFWLCMPQRYQKMMPPLRPYGVSVSAECHRQMMYSMLVHDKPARNPYWKWIEVNLSTEEGREMGRSEELKVAEIVEPGDYFLFEPTPASDILPDLLPMAFMVIRFTDIERVAFNRTLNVAFYCRLPAAVNFIHRMLFDFIIRAPSDRVSLRRNKIRLSHQLAQEFPEFGAFADPGTEFDFGKEWKGIELLILHFECRHPLLRAWCREDPERQRSGERRSSVWSRFVGLEWDGVIDPDFVDGYPVPRGIFSAGYYGVEPSIYEPELEEKYRERVLAALARAEEEREE